MTFNIAVLPGDGIGPEVVEIALKVLARAAEYSDFQYNTSEWHFGGAAIDAHGDPYPAETREACKAANALLLGAVGGPKWDGGSVRPEQGLLGLRKDLGLFANLRPLKVFPGLEEASPIKTDRVTGTDMVIVRELTGGLYFGDREEGDERALDTCAYSRHEVERIAKVAFETARGRKNRLTSVDKANVLATSRLWRRTVEAVHEDYPDVELEHVLVDAMAMHLVRAPADYDVILTENLFGDILSDEASVLSGSIGLAGSASLNESRQGLYEPIHGSAPDIAGTGKANPAGAILSVAMMLRHSANKPEIAKKIEFAVTTVIGEGARTADLGGSYNCTEFGNAVLSMIK